MTSVYFWGMARKLLQIFARRSLFFHAGHLWAGNQSWDLDGDAIANGKDNCPYKANPYQIDKDRDGIGNVCDQKTLDDDRDNDGIKNFHDNCPDKSNPFQADNDGDGFGNACDTTTVEDIDGDGIANSIDNCVTVFNPEQLDFDKDGLGNACDSGGIVLDVDQDGILNAQDNCPFVANPDQSDLDANGVGDMCDDSKPTADQMIDKLKDMASSMEIKSNWISMAQGLLSCVNATPNDQNAMQGVCQEFIGKIKADPQSAVNMLRSLLPMNPDAAGDLSTNNSRMSVSAGQQRMSRLRSGSALIENPQNQFWVNNEWHQPGALFADNSSSANDASGVVAVDKNISEFGKLGVFVNMAIMKAGQDGDGAELQSDANTSVLTIGSDYRFTDSLLAGVAINLDQTKTDFESGFTSGSLDADGYSLLFYGSYYMQEWFVDASVTLGNQSYEQFRAPSIGNTYSATFDAQQSTISTSVGRDFTIQAFSATPFIQLVMGSVDTDAYREKASDPLSNEAIGLDQSSKVIGNINIGSNFHYVVNTNNGVFIPSSLTLVRELQPAGAGKYE